MFIMVLVILLAIMVLLFVGYYCCVCLTCGLFKLPASHFAQTDEPGSSAAVPGGHCWQVEAPAPLDQPGSQDLQ